MRIVNENVFTAKEQGGKDFFFSVIVAAYNVEEFIEETINSLIEQDFGFENVQLVIVDDGSADATGEICDRYAEQYPDNIAVIHKENGGVSSARNEGLKRITGKYVNFLDADDKLTPNTLSMIFEFLEKNGHLVDVVSIPLVFFDGATGNHILNYKFEKGTRIIDLQKEPNAIQMSSGSSFISTRVFRENNIGFDERLSFAEDAKVVQRILNIKKKLGVVKQCQYLYRRRSSGSASAIQTSQKSKAWWLDYMKYFQWDTVMNNLDEDGLLPSFIQETLCYDLQWRVKIPEINHEILDDEDIRAYKELMSNVLAYIDDSVILGQKNIFVEHKLYLLMQKYKSCPDCIWYKPKNRISMFYKGLNTGISLNALRTEYRLLEIKDNEIILYGNTKLLNCGIEAIGVGVLFDETQSIPGEWIGADEPETILDDTAITTKSFCVRIPLSILTGKNRLKLYVEYELGKVLISTIRYGNLMPVVPSVENSYFSENGIAITCDSNTLFVNKISASEEKEYEKKLEAGLKKKDDSGIRKAATARKLARISSRFKGNKKIWLISDRIMRAGDNGEALFRYLCEKKPSDIKCYFVMSKDSVDYERMKKIGPVVEYASKKHKLLQLMADDIISSAGEANVVNPFGKLGIYYSNFIYNKNFIFLQHGVTKDNLAGWLNRLNKNIKGLVTSAYPEYESIINEPGYIYSEKEIWLTGMPRFDRLYTDSKRMITIMPTWRKYLSTATDMMTGTSGVVTDFEESDYCKYFSALMNDKRLLDAAKQYGYTIQFYPHPNLVPFADKFNVDPSIRVLNEETEYRQVYAESDLVVTDYSSTVFDFVYLKKPIIYSQFDSDTFFSGEHTYKKGYFDYERDGFGEVEYTLESTVDRIIEYMRNGCQMKKVYRDRVDSFFAYHDQNNCQRVYEKIRELDQQDAKQ